VHARPSSRIVKFSIKVATAASATQVSRPQLNLSSPTRGSWPYPHDTRRAVSILIRIPKGFPLTQEDPAERKVAAFRLRTHSVPYDKAPGGTNTGKIERRHRGYASDPPTKAPPGFDFNVFLCIFYLVLTLSAIRLPHNRSQAAPTRAFVVLTTGLAILP
jgi:hypothetical protein